MNREKFTAKRNIEVQCKYNIIGSVNSSFKDEVLNIVGHLRSETTMLVRLGMSVTHSQFRWQLKNACQKLRK